VRISIDKYASVATITTENPASISNNIEILSKESKQLFSIVDWLPPDFGAVGQYGAIFGRDLAVAGRDVRLIGLTTGDYSTAQEFLPNETIFEITRIHSMISKKINIYCPVIMDISNQYANSLGDNPRF
jgi:hypothetical protein